MKPEQIKKMLEEISPWPWNKYIGGGENADEIIAVVTNHEQPGHRLTISQPSFDIPQRQLTMEFIAAAPQIISDLIKDNERLNTQLKVLCVDQVLREEKLKKQNEVMREALEFYKPSDNWNDEYPGGIRCADGSIDLGNKAKQALDECERLEKN